MPERVRITDVSPRDGLQNEPRVIPPHDKVELVRAVASAGVDEIEVTSFVSPKWIPQLGDAADVLGALARSPLPSPAPILSALVPNEQGLDRLLEQNELARSVPGGQAITKASVFTAASETFSLRNTNATIAQTIERFRPVVVRTHAAGLRVRGYVSCAVACPFEGPIAPARAAEVVRRLTDLGVDEIDVADTIGVATPDTITAMLDAVMREADAFLSRPGERQSLIAERLTLHLHDTFGRAGSCVVAALGLGVRSFDASVAGLGGCPYAGTPQRRAPGNISTELLVRVCREAGYSTGVDEAALAAAAATARRLVAPIPEDEPPPADKPPSADSHAV